MAKCVCVVLKPEIVFYIRNLGCFAQVSILKSRVKHQHVLVVGYVLLRREGEEITLLGEPR